MEIASAVLALALASTQQAEVPLTCYYGDRIVGSTAPDALVVIELPSTGFRREVKADSRGNFELRDLLRGTYTVTADGKTWEETLSYTTCARVPKITRRPGGYHGERIEGTTTPGAAVVIERIDKEFRTEIVADRSGNYRLKRLEPGKYKVTANDVTRYVELRYVYHPTLKDVVD